MAFNSSQPLDGPAEARAVEPDSTTGYAEQANVARHTTLLRSSRLPHVARRLELLGALIVIGAVMSSIQFAGPAILDNDGYYHIRWAKILREKFPHLPAFKALPLTTLDEQHYVDHHYLFHILLFPFTLGDLRIGAKTSAVFFSSLGIGSIFALLWVYRIPYRWLWLLPLIASSEPFLYRMSMTRAPALSLLLLGTGTWLILNRRFLLLSLLAFTFVWSYSLFPLVGVFALVYSIVIYLSERRIDLWAPLAAGVGIAGGLLINPYFPKNIHLFMEHLLMKVTDEYPVSVGQEWYTYEAWYMFTSSALAFVVFAIGVAAFQYRDRVRDPKPLFFLIVSAILLLMSIKSRRFMEYFPPFAVAFSAFTIAPRLSAVDYSWARRTRDRAIAAITASVVTVAAVTMMSITVFQARAEIAGEPSPYSFRGASQYVAAHSSPGSMIFNTSWDTFPALFYYNPDYSYISGLDPSYSFDHDPELWKLYESITNGDQENAGSLIRERFGAEYVITGNGTSDFLTAAEDSGDFERVFEDSDAIVLRVRGPGEPRPVKRENDDSDTQ